MLNSEISFLVKGVVSSSKNIKTDDGDKIKEKILKVTFVTSNISYDEIKEFNPKLYELLTLHAPIEFDTISLKNVADSVSLKVFKENDENKVEYEFKNVKICRLVVKNDKDIPVYNFLLEIPLYDKSAVHFLNLNVKSSVMGVFS